MPRLEKCDYLPILLKMFIGTVKITHKESFKDNKFSILRCKLPQFCFIVFIFRFFSDLTTLILGPGNVWFLLRFRNQNQKEKPLAMMSKLVFYTLITTKVIFVFIKQKKFTWKHFPWPKIFFSFLLKRLWIFHISG